MSGIAAAMRLMAVAASFLLWPWPCGAGGILHVFPPTFQEETFAVARLNVLRSRSVITVSESSIEYRFDQTFFNDNDLPLQGLFLLPLDTRQPRLDLDVRINGDPVRFETVSAEAFFPTLRELTEQAKDPSLLGLAGRDMLVVRGVSTGVRKQETFRVHYKVPFLVENDHMGLDIPLDGERYSLGPVDSLELMVRFKMSHPVRTLFSPTHHLTVARESPQRCLAVVRAEKRRVMQDFQLLTTFSGQDLDLRLFAHRDPGEKGSFMALVAPPLSPARPEEAEKDVVFVLDASGGMGKTPLSLAKAAVIAGLEHLRPTDRFNVLVVQTRPKRMSPRLLPADTDHVMEAVKFVNATNSEGGADLYNGLMNALEQFRSRKRPCVIVLAGLGRRTVGVTGPETIIEDLRRRNRVRARVLTLAVGGQADVAVLDKVAVANRGVCLQVAENDDLPAVMNRLLASVAPAQIADLSLDFLGITPEGVIPDPIPEMLAQDGVAVLGRYDEKEDKTATVRLKGRIKGRTRTVTRSFVFPEREQLLPYLPTLWAMRQIGKLLERDLLKGPELDVRQQIRSLATEFGFRTPFPPKSASATAPLAPARKDAGTLLWLFKTSSVPADVQSDQYKTVGEKIFRSAGGAWVDNRFRPSFPARNIRFMSEEYFSLLKADPSLGKYLALGPRVTLVPDREAIVVTDGSEAQ